MFQFLKNHTYPIGVDAGDDTLKVVQLASNGKGMSVIAGGSENRPADVKTGTGNWQRWAIEAIHKLTTDKKFRGRDVIAAVPASEMFIDHIKMPTPFCEATRNESQNDNPMSKKNDRLPNERKWGRGPDDKLQEAVFSKIKQKLPFEPDEAMMKCIPTEQNNVLVMASERKKIDRHLAIYEKANLQIKSIGVWPAALANSYAGFFGRRKSDIEAIVMLLDIEPDCTKAVICRHKSLLFARSISIGTKQLDSDELITRLVLELTACRRHFVSMHKKAQIERLIFLSGLAVNGQICTTIAKQLEMPAQIGDCLTAVKMAEPQHLGIDRRECELNWATALGLSLS